MEADDVARSLAFLDAHQPDRARELARAALAQNPLDGHAHMVLARVTLIAGEFAASESHLRSAAADPGCSADAYAELSKVLGLDGERAPEAAKAAASAVRLDPESWRHRNTYAAALADIGDAAGAARESDAALGLAPADPFERAEAMSRVGMTLVQQPGNRDRGLALITEASALDPTDPLLRLQLMSALAVRKRWASALAAAGATLALDPRSPFPPILSRVAVFMITRKLLGWMALASFLVPMLTLAPFSAIGSLDGDVVGAIAVRVMCVTALIVDVTIAVLVLRPALTQSGRRTLWKFSRRSPMTWFGGIAIGTALLSYAVGVVWGHTSMIPTLPMLLLPVAWWVHGWGVHALPTGDMHAAVVQQLR